MSQAIVTKFFGPTNSRGSRIKAASWAGSITVSYDHSLDVEENHKAAAIALINKKGWNSWKDGKWVMGGSPDTTGYCFVNVAEYNSFDVE